jgi:very-short-patch-repair endonuclease
MTPAEEKLWRRLRAHPLGLFIADFYCAEHRLVVEIDGGIHTQQVEHDQVRTEQFEAYGYHVIRFKNA